MSGSKSMSTQLILEGGVSSASRGRKAAAGNLISHGLSIKAFRNFYNKKKKANKSPTKA